MRLLQIFLLIFVVTLIQFADIISASDYTTSEAFSASIKIQHLLKPLNITIVIKQIRHTEQQKKLMIHLSVPIQALLI